MDLPPHASISFPKENDLMNFCVVIDLGKEDECLWRQGKYSFRVAVPPGYPHMAPKVHCDTPIYHPNIDTEGNVCLNILRKDWKPVLGVNPVILGLVFLFIEPNPEDPLNHDAAKVLRENPK
jgi:ubiquitin-conjugating enzyme E2 M